MMEHLARLDIIGDLDDSTFNVRRGKMAKGGGRKVEGAEGRVRGYRGWKEEGRGEDGKKEGR